LVDKVGSQDIFSIDTKTLVSKFTTAYQTSGTQANPAAGTKSTDLQRRSSSECFFANPDY
jgi:hypothetical protein